MRYFVVFGTVEGHTRRIAEAVVSGIVEAKHEVILYDVLKKSPDLAKEAYDACLIAAPVHQQRHPDEIINFIKAHAGQLNGAPSALISVSLSAAFADGQVEAQSYVDRLLRTTGWSPTATHCAAGALRYSQYDFFQEQVIRHVVLQGHDVGDIQGDHAFTDWEALGRFVQKFIEASAGPG